MAEMGSWSLDNELRIVLVGKTGEGKSAIGNALLGNKFFESKADMGSVTATTGVGTADRFGTKLHVIDTPGFFDTKMTKEQIQKEIVKSVGAASPGPHVFVVVIACDRFTTERQETLEQLEEMFSKNGSAIHPFTIVVFSKMGQLEGQTIEEFVNDAPEELRKFLAGCNGRYKGIETRGSNVQEQAKSIVDLCLELKSSGKYYSDDLTRQIDKKLKESAANEGIPYTDARFNLLDELSTVFVYVFEGVISIVSAIADVVSDIRGIFEIFYKFWGGERGKRAVKYQ